MYSTFAFFLFLIICFQTQGLFGEITGPTLQDLKLRVNTTYEEVSKAIEGRSAGFFAGAVLGENSYVSR